MQLKITFRNQEVLDFPVNYNYYIQSAIFSLLAEESSEYAGELHNIAFGGIAKFKMFTFSPLLGKCHFHDKILYFEGDITLEIRSASDTFMQVLANSLLKVGEMRIGRHTLYITRVEVCDYQIENSVINIKTIAPIVCKVTTDDKKTIYFSPNEVMFIKLIRENFEKKLCNPY